MNNRPLYENLDTSFVDLTALVRYLRQREFVGQIKVELNNYQAEITLNDANKLRVREHDKISGRVAEGEEAFQRILARAKETGGTVHVYHTVANTRKTEVPTQISNGNSSATPVEPIKKVAAAATQNGNIAKTTATVELPKKPQENGLKMPFDLGNRFAPKPRGKELSADEWQLLLNLAGELIGTIDRSLAEAKLGFKSAFSKSRSEISADYPFLSPSNKKFVYENGKLTMTEQVSSTLFVSGIIESLRKILEKLGSNPKFAEVYRSTVQKTLALLNRRQPHYDKFYITAPLKKILGI